ncbi:hypothetical protein UF64_06985 [Thalassospira sp. HJ]|nr:hypothetical protein UF64_06985 [Thalassospira sp. HJ]
MNKKAASERIRLLEFQLMRTRELVENQYLRITALEALLGKESETGDARQDVPSMTRYQCDDMMMVKDFDPAYFQTACRLPPASVNPGLGCYGLNNQVDLVIAVLTFARSTEETGQIVGRIFENQCRTRGFRPVFFTDNPDFTPFRRNRYVYEYFPSQTLIKRGAEQGREYQKFGQEKFVFALKKWGINTILDISRSHPFEIF